MYVLQEALVMQIDLLTDHPNYIDTLAPWLLAYWRPFLPEDTLEMRIDKLVRHCNRDTMPLALVAHDGDHVFGTAALRTCDLPGYERLTPWLGGVFVGETFRGRGIGAKLCQAIEAITRTRFHLEEIYLFTLDKTQWYSNLGWSAYLSCEWEGQPGTIMKKSLTPP